MRLDPAWARSVQVLGRPRVSCGLCCVMGLDLKAPDHSTLSRRGEEVEVPRLCREQEEPVHSVVDSTGLKISSAGDWSSRKHRKREARRGWRKLHIGADDEGFVVAAQLTGSKRDDASVVPDLLEQIDAEVRRPKGPVRSWLSATTIRTRSSSCRRTSTEIRQQIEREIRSDASPVGIDAMKTHVPILYMLAETGRRLVTVE